MFLHGHFTVACCMLHLAYFRMLHVYCLCNANQTLLQNCYKGKLGVGEIMEDVFLQLRADSKYVGWWSTTQAASSGSLYT